MEVVWTDADMSKGFKLRMNRSRFFWSIIAVFAAVLGAVIAAPDKWVSEDGLAIWGSAGLKGLGQLAAVFAAAAFLFAVGFWKRPLTARVFKWAFSRRMLRRFLYGLCSFTLLVALFYGEEDWRGRYDWEQFKRTWEAKGERFDVASFVRPGVPDDQNFACTPIIANSCIVT